MTVVAEKRDDFMLEAYRRVAWAEEPVRIADSAVEVVRQSRDRFLQLPNRDLDVVIYGVTTGSGQTAEQRLDPDQRRA